MKVQKILSARVLEKVLADLKMEMPKENGMICGSKEFEDNIISFKGFNFGDGTVDVEVTISDKADVKFNKIRYCSEAFFRKEIEEWCFQHKCKDTTLFHKPANGFTEEEKMMIVSVFQNPKSICTLQSAVDHLAEIKDYFMKGITNFGMIALPVDDGRINPTFVYK